MSIKFYAIKKGKKIGIFTSWEEAKKNIDGYPNAVYKSFKTLNEAQKYLKPSNAFINTEGLNIFVDGSYNKDNNIYAWSFVVLDKDSVIYKDSGIGRNKEAAKLMNVAGELSATMRAAIYVAKIKKKAVIHHDYAGIANWCTGSWETKTEITKQYKEFMSKFKNIIGFKKVKGHSGNIGNEIADELCTLAIKEAIA